MRTPKCSDNIPLDPPSKGGLSSLEHRRQFPFEGGCCGTLFLGLFDVESFPVGRVVHDARIDFEQFLFQLGSDRRKLGRDVCLLPWIRDQVKQLEIRVAACLDRRDPRFLERGQPNVPNAKALGLFVHESPAEHLAMQVAVVKLLAIRLSHNFRDLLEQPFH